jgi:4-aminobutyrate aminotransferase-like enzyme
VDEAIASLEEAGHGVSATLFDPLFSTEGMPRLPQGYVEGLTSRVRKAGGMIIADEVQSGFGRTGTHMWGFQAVGMDPDLVTMGKPMGNGHPVSAVVTSEAVLDAFGSSNEFFNTFAGNPVSAAAAQAVLEEMDSEDLMGRARAVSAAAREELARLVDAHDFLSTVRGQGMFMGIDFTVDGEPRTDLARAAVQGMKERHVLISKIGRHENVLKMRPPLAFGLDELPVFLQALGETLDQIRV